MKYGGSEIQGPMRKRDCRERKAQAPPDSVTLHVNRILYDCLARRALCQADPRLLFTDRFDIVT